MSNVITVAIAAAIPGLISAVISYLNRRHIAEVHVLVNSKMTEALKTIASLRSDAATSALVVAASAADNLDLQKKLETEASNNPKPMV